MKGIKFGEVHSYYDLNLILSQCIIKPPKAKTSYIDIPGTDGTLDLSEAFGDVKFGDRTGSIVFSVLPTDDWELKKSEISNFLHGQKFNITLDTDPDYYYQGRCSVNDYKSDKKNRQISVDLTLNPWKLKQDITTVEVTRGINSYVPIDAVLMNDRMPAIVTANVKTNITLEYGGNIQTLNNGTHELLDLRLSQGKNIIKVKGATDSAVTFTYQEGSL